MANRTTKVWVWFTALAVIMACAPTFSAAPSIPTLEPGAINTMIVQTANAASTQTAAALPTSTPTETFTPTPRSTTTSEATATGFVWIVISPTNPISAALTAANIRSNKNYDCLLISTTPANGTSFTPRKNFDATWRVKNIGKKDWEKNSTDFIYLRGDKFHKVSGYDFKKTLQVGVTGDLTVSMQAPKNTGFYTTYWTLRVGSEEFCEVSLTISVN